MTYTEYKPYVIDTGYLFPPSLADFLGTEDEVHIFREVTEQLGCRLSGLGLQWHGAAPLSPQDVASIAHVGDG